MKNFRGIFWKVVFGFGIVACLLASSYWITYDRLNTLKNKITGLAEVNPRSAHRNKIIRNIDAIDSYIKKYTISKNDSLLYKYDSCVYSIGNEMDELSRIAINDKVYSKHLDRLGYYINDKLEISGEKVSLANGHTNDSELSHLITEIMEPENPAPETPVKKDTAEKENFFSRLFSGKRAKKKFEKKETITEQKNVVSTAKVKSLLQQAQRNEKEKSRLYLKETLLLIEKDDRIQDSIRAESAALEKSEITESLKAINKLTDETSGKTSNILTALLVSGILTMLLFITIVYREVQHNNRLRKELISEKKNTERLAKAKEEFLANMSHEIRTPMNVIVGFSEQLLKTELKQDQKNMLLNIKRSSQHLITIINEILDYSKIESGAVTLENIVFNVEEVFNDVLVSFHPLADKKKIAFRYKIEDNVSRSIVGDPMRLKQILFNLVGNAIKFTEKGSVEFICKVCEATETEQTLLFEVTDTGIGMSAESQATIFEQFTQADSSVTRKYGGTGLGLAISKKLVQLQCGEIDVKSEEGKGSIFYFAIPYRLPEKEDFPKQVLEETVDKELLKGIHVLIADDEEMNKLLVELILENCEMEIDTASNGVEAFEKIKNKKYDVILMDLHMPQMGGLETVIRMRKQNINTPVIAVTGNVLKGEKEKCMDAGMNGYISKPYNEAELLQKIIQVVKRPSEKGQ